MTKPRGHNFLSRCDPPLPLTVPFPHRQLGARKDSAFPSSLRCCPSWDRPVSSKWFCNSINERTELWPSSVSSPSLPASTWVPRFSICCLPGCGQLWTNSCPPLQMKIPRSSVVLTQRGMVIWERYRTDPLLSLCPLLLPNLKHEEPPQLPSRVLCMGKFSWLWTLTSVSGTGTWFIYLAGLHLLIFSSQRKRLGPLRAAPAPPWRWWAGTADIHRSLRTPWCCLEDCGAGGTAGS